MLLFVGNKNPFGEGGISVFRYSQRDGSLTLLGTQHTEVSAGFLCTDEKNARLFCVNERLECDGVPGGQVLCYQIDSQTGDLTPLSIVSTSTVLPCYLHFISEECRLLVCNHAKRDWTLKLESTAEGTVFGKKTYDDAVLEVFDVLQNGTIVGPNAYWIAPSSGKANDNPHLHSITFDAQNRQSYICDTGSNVIYTVANNKDGVPKLMCSVEPMAESSAPRYGVLHPYLPIAYFNSEKQNALFVFEIRERALIPLQVTAVVDIAESLKIPLGQSAMAVNRAGSVLYTLVRRTCSVSVFSISPEGRLQLVQSYPLGYDNPRALAISPDEKYMFISCSVGRAVIRMQINDDGCLFNQTLVDDSLSSPSCMLFYPLRS